jgi:alkanesulfonate monooxygenase SsuD/methylene tetrahydromethanopterin reductase-like flavin-dependent oxidoreductase (luciferase family)
MVMSTREASLRNAAVRPRIGGHPITGAQMQFGFWMPAKIDDVDVIVAAEALGYRSVWLGDSEMIWSDCYATAAVAAARTRTIRIGPGVAVAGTRIAPVTAAAITTINRLAPGRTFLALGRGDSAWRMTGHRPVAMAQFEDYVRTVRGLIRGEEVPFTHDEVTTRVALAMAEHGFVDTEHAIPLWIGAIGPRARAVAGAIGDGIIGVHQSRAAVLEADAHARVGAQRAGRALGPERFPIAVHVNVVVLAPGEDARSPRVLEEAGPAALVRLHGTYLALSERHGHEGARAALDTVPGAIAPIWEDYCDVIARTPIEARHGRIQAGHFTFVHPDEYRFLTPELLTSTCLIGTPEEIRARVVEVADAGASEFLVLAPPSRLRASLERFAATVMRRL